MSPIHVPRTKIEVEMETNNYIPVVDFENGFTNATAKQSKGELTQTKSTITT